MTSPNGPFSDAPTGGPWTLWTVLRQPVRGESTPGAAVADSPRSAAPSAPGEPLATAVGRLADGVVLRGVYDVSGLRADADLMVWLHGERAEDLQSEIRRLRRSAELAPLEGTWAVMGVHRPAEFSADHLPAYMRDTEPARWLTVYPFVRSYDWYLLPSEERRAMLGEHGRMGRGFPSVLSNTVASFALGDYEWLLGLEADELTDLVDLMRALRAAEARRHVREEVPFFTGRRIEVDEVAAVLR